MRNESWLDIRILKTPEMLINRKTWNAFKITPRSGKSKRIWNSLDYGF